MGLNDRLRKIVKSDKINPKDVGMIDDAIFCVKNLTSWEDHLTTQIAKMPDEKDKQKFSKILNEVRERRSLVMQLIVKENPKGSEWCLDPNTHIITSKGLKQIKAIHEGDFVLTHKNRFRKVLKVMNRKISEKIVSVKTNYSNIPIRLTKEHLFYIAKNVRKPQTSSWKKNFKKPNFTWKESSKLTRNDFIYLPSQAREFSKIMNFDYNGGKKTSGNFAYVGKDYFLIPVISTNEEFYKGEVWNLEVEEDNSYCTFNGVVHNCQTKHGCNASMGLLELGNRFLTLGDQKKAMRCFKESIACIHDVFEINDIPKFQEKEITEA